MPSLFSQEEKFRITRALGIEEFDRLSERVEIALDKIADPGRYTRVMAILDKLDTFDDRIFAAVEKMNVIQVDTIKLNYAPLVNHLKAEATRCLSELSNLLGLEITYNKFTGQSGSSGGGSPYSVRSLC